MRVLVVEDGRDLAEALVRGLSRQDLAVDLAADLTRTEMEVLRLLLAADGVIR